MVIINPPKKILAKLTSVNCRIKKGKISSFVKYSNKNHSFKLRRERGETSLVSYFKFIFVVPFKTVEGLGNEMAY